MMVIIESPFAGDFVKNREYANECLRDSLLRGEAPFMSHILYTEALDDTIPEERAIGIQAGLKVGQQASKTIVYTDLGISHGMELGIKSAERNGRKVEYRTIQNPLVQGH